MTKKQEWMLDKYNASSTSELRQVYYSWSDKKEEAYKKCRMKQADHNGYDGRITSKSPYKFSFAFRYKDECGREHLYYITKGKDTDFVIG